MTSSPKMSSTQLPFTKEEIADHGLVYSRQRLKNQLFEVVLQAFVERFRRNNLNKSDLAFAMKRDPAQITRWLKGPGNWTLDTVSDILRALRADLRVSFTFYEDNRPNFEHELALSDLDSDYGMVVASEDLEIKDVRSYSAGRVQPETIVAFLTSHKKTATESFGGH